MVVDFSEIEETVLKNFKGGEKETRAHMYTDDKNRIMKGILVPGASIGLHTHDTSSEIIYIIEGTATLIFDDTTETITKGCCHYCPMGHTHSLMNKSDTNLVFVAVIPQH